MLRISVVTASLPTRSVLLTEACASVAAQSLPPIEHLIGVDHDRRGSSAVRNQLARSARGDVLAFLDDDDILYPWHLLRLADLIRGGADVAYAQCDAPNWQSPVRPFDAEALQAGNFIPATVLVAADLFRAAGGFPDSSQVEHGWEDWALWKRLYALGGSFAYCAEPTWLYRLHAGSKTLVGEVAAC